MLDMSTWMCMIEAFGFLPTPRLLCAGCGRCSCKDDCHAGAAPWARFDLETRLSVLPERLDNQRTEFAPLRPFGALRKTDAIISYNNATTFVVSKALQRDSPAIAPLEGVLKGVGQEFVDHQPGGHGHIHGYRISINLEIEPNALHRMRTHHRGCDLTQIDAKIDLVTSGVFRQRFIKELHGFDASGEPIERRDHCSTSHVARFQTDQRRDHLQIVLDAVLDFSKQRILLPNSFL